MDSGCPLGARVPIFQNFKNFVFQARSLKISHNIDHVNQKSYQLTFFGLGAPFGLPGAPKCQNFRHFVFQVRSLKISLNIDHVNQKSYQLKFFGLIAPFGVPRPQCVEKIKILSFELESSKFYMLILCNRIEIC